MRGLVYTRAAGPEALKLTEVETPSPSEHQVLVQVRSSSLNYSDYSRFETHVRTGATPVGERFKETAIKRSVGQVIGSEVAGIVTQVGEAVAGIHPGDAVFGVTPGLKGAWAEYAVLAQDRLAIIPSHLTFDQAATVATSGTTALAALRAARLRGPAKLLVYGASGGVGQYVVQLAKALRDIRVAAVCSTRNVEAVERLGADVVIDYQTEDFTRTGTYDAIIAVNGYHSLHTYKPLLNPGGTYVAVGGARQGMEGMLLGPLLSLGSGKRLTAATYMTEIKKGSLPRLADLMERHHIEPYIEATCALDEVPDTIARLVRDHPRGKTAIRIRQGD